MCVSVFNIIFESTGVKYSVFGGEEVGGTYPFALNKAQKVASFP